MEPIDDLRLLDITARRGSFSAAARHLGLTRSAVSKRIAQLESRIGLALVRRTTRSMHLTDAGERLVLGARPHLDALARLTDDLISEDARLVGRAKIAAPLTFGMRRVRPLLEAFQRDHADVSLDVQYDDQWVDLIANGIDLAIRGGSLEASTLLARRLRGIGVGLFASGAYLQHRDTPSTPQALSLHRMIRASREPLVMAHPKWGSVTIREPASLVANPTDARVEAALGGLGIAVLPDFAVPPGLVPILPEWTPGGIRPRAFYLLRPPGPASRLVQTLSEVLFSGLSAGCGPRR